MREGFVRPQQQQLLKEKKVIGITGEKRWLNSVESHMIRSNDTTIPKL